MRIALGCDHGGFPLKQRIAAVIQAAGHDVVDCGTDSSCSVDYPDFALKVSQTILARSADRGVLLCGSGVGISVARTRSRESAQASVTTPIRPTRGSNTMT